MHMRILKPALFRIRAQTEQLQAEHEPDAMSKIS